MVLGSNTHLTAAGEHVRPIHDRFFVPLQPGTLARFLKQLPDLKVLIVNRRLGVNRNEFEDHRQGIVLLDDTADELRSEEHTSELQSLTNLVCRLLLEKKKK